LTCPELKLAPANARAISKADVPRFFSFIAIFSRILFVPRRAQVERRASSLHGVFPRAGTAQIAFGKLTRAAVSGNASQMR